MRGERKEDSLRNYPAQYAFFLPGVRSVRTPGLPTSQVVATENRRLELEEEHKRMHIAVVDAEHAAAHQARAIAEQEKHLEEVAPVWVGILNKP